ncbi:glutaredoxin domain-containing protein [Alkalihalobacillus sp. FSL R5-0424]
MSITVYTRSGCKYCDYLKNFLQSSKKEYIEKDISISTNRDEFNNKNVQAVPLTILNEEKYVGFTEELKSAILNSK